MSITKDPATAASKGFGFVKYRSKEVADQAKAPLHGDPSRGPLPMQGAPQTLRVPCSLSHKLPEPESQGEHSKFKI